MAAPSKRQNNVGTVAAATGGRVQRAQVETSEVETCGMPDAKGDNEPDPRNRVDTITAAAEGTVAAQNSEGLKMVSLDGHPVTKPGEAVPDVLIEDETQDQADENETESQDAAPSGDPTDTTGVDISAADDEPQRTQASKEGEMADPEGLAKASPEFKDVPARTTGGKDDEQQSLAESKLGEADVRTDEDSDDSE